MISSLPIPSLVYEYLPTQLWLAKAHGPVPLVLVPHCSHSLQLIKLGKGVPNPHPYHPPYPFMLMQTELVLLTLVLGPA